MPKGGKMPYLPRDPKGRHVPGYPSKIDGGTTSPEGYQREARGHSPSSAGTKVPIKRG